MPYLGCQSLLRALTQISPFEGETLGWKILVTKWPLEHVLALWVAIDCRKRVNAVAEGLRSNSRGRLVIPLGVRGTMRMNSILGAV